MVTLFFLSNAPSVPDFHVVLKSRFASDKGMVVYGQSFVDGDKVFYIRHSVQSGVRQLSRPQRPLYLFLTLLLHFLQPS